MLAKSASTPHNRFVTHQSAGRSDQAWPFRDFSQRMTSEPAHSARQDAPAQRIAVIGSGIAGLSAAWLLSQQHEVTLYEAASRLGGHTNTVMAPQPDGAADVPVDTGFIVYNEATYPNLTALLAHVGCAHEAAPTCPSRFRSTKGRLEYNGSTDFKSALFAQKQQFVSNLRFWGMLRDLVRFYRDRPGYTRTRRGSGHDDARRLSGLIEGGYGRAFRDDHLIPHGGCDLVGAARARCSATTLRRVIHPLFARIMGFLSSRSSGRPDVAHRRWAVAKELCRADLASRLDADRIHTGYTRHCSSCDRARRRLAPP